MDEHEPLLAVEGLNVRFPGPSGVVEAVRDVSFTLRRERLGIVGESGSGKSTTGRAVLRLIQPPGQVSATRMALGGVELQMLSEKAMRNVRGERISMVMQDPKYSLNPVMRVGEQIAEGYRLHSRAGAAQAREKTLEILAAVRIRDPIRVYRAYPSELSGGMGQRVMIAMMLIPDPDLLIADEPTSALDVTVQMQILAIIDDLVSQRGMGLIFISHDLNLVASFCDRVLIMNDGQIVEQCKASTLSKATHPYTVKLLSCLPRIDKATATGRGARQYRDAMIDVHGLDVHFGSARNAVHAVRDLSFRIQPGESFGLVGESGSGKSTVLHAISGLNNDWTGSLHVAGLAQGARRNRDFHKSLQMVFQDPYGSLHPRHTVDRALSEPLRIHGYAQVEQRVVSALEDVGLGPAFRFRYPHQLSGGQRQRVAIARAMILEPRVLLLDEPTSALDVSVQSEVLELLTRLKAEHELTYLLVSHDLAVVGQMCERIAVMSEGRIVEELTCAQLASGEASDPYTRQLLAASQGYDRNYAATLMSQL